MNDQLTADLASLHIERKGTPPRTSSRRLFYALAALAVIPALGLGGYRIALPRLSAEIFKTEVSMTTIALVSPAESSVDLTSTGYLVPQVTVDGSSRIAGRVAEVRVREGDEVKVGAVLFLLDPIDQRSAIATARARVASSRARSAAARAQLAESRQQWEREKKLAAAGTTALAVADDLGAHVRTLEEQARVVEQDTATAEAEASALTVDLALFTIRAPISGRALTKPVDVGSVVSPGQPMVKLADFESLLVEADVPEARLYRVKRGGPCEVTFDAYPTRRFRGEVADIAPGLNRAKGAALVKVKVEGRDDSLLPEMAARVSFLAKALDPAQLKEPPKRVVPKKAVADRGGAKVVFQVEDGRVRAVPVTLGPELGAGFEITEGPPPGTKIIDAPPLALANGQAIKEKTVQ